MFLGSCKLGLLQFDARYREDACQFGETGFWQKIRIHREIAKHHGRVPKEPP
ncbi:MAG: hypothetical protein [Olavius algarvensis Delta 4 endosymbiont]|nr:MAG: hypothetical protein [Olavius algarvensis Delta 4 endosymbiont]